MKNERNPKKAKTTKTIRKAGLLTAEQVMKKLGIGKTSLWRLGKKGVLEAHALPGLPKRKFYKIEDVQRLLNV